MASIMKPEDQPTNSLNQSPQNPSTPAPQDDNQGRLQVQPLPQAQSAEPVTPQPPQQNPPSQPAPPNQQPQVPTEITAATPPPITDQPASASYEQSAPRPPKNLLIVEFFKDKKTWIAGAILLAIIFLSVVFQLSYSADRLAYNIQVDGVEVGGMRRKDAAKLLTQKYGKAELDIFLGDSKQVFKTANVEEAGISTSHEKRLAQIEYPWYLRIVPTSIFWAGSSENIGQPEVSYDKKQIAEFVDAKMGKDCKILPKGATLGIERTYLTVVPSVKGGICDDEKVERLLTKVEPSLTDTEAIRVETIPIEPIITNDIAKAVADKLNKRFELPMPIVVDKAEDKVAREEVLSWLDFRPHIPKPGADEKDKPKITYSVDNGRLETYLTEARIIRKLSVKPVANKVSTKDFKVTSKKTGKAGIGVDIAKTANLVDSYIAKEIDTVKIATKVVPQPTDYTRKYTATNNGFKAMLHQFAFDNDGILSASFIELKRSDSRSKARSADFVGTKVVKAGGIENVFIEFATLVAIETNKTYWGERVLDSLTVENCYNKLIETNDTDCREALLNRLTFDYVTNLLKEIGMNQTSFGGKQPTTSANDLREFMQKISDEEYGYKIGNKLLKDLEATTFRDGIRKGVGDGNETSSAVGADDSIINEASFVNSSQNGDYVLVVMSSGSNWETIAKLAEMVQELHVRKT